MTDIPVYDKMKRKTAYFGNKFLKALHIDKILHAN